MTTHNNNLERLWGSGSPRVFISHISEYRELAHSLKSALNSYGIASFVAHDDIEPMKEWEDEIVRALRSMDMLVALLTKGFRTSKWTDQEVGAALGRQVRVIPVRMGTDPYGFIGRYQAISEDPKKPGAAARIASAVFKYILGTNAGPPHFNPITKILRELQYVQAAGKLSV